MHRQRHAVMTGDLEDSLDKWTLAADRTQVMPRQARVLAYATVRKHGGLQTA